MSSSCESKDIFRSRRYVSGLWLYTVLLIGAQFVWPKLNVWFAAAIVFPWGISCLTNALRCGRLHCYISGPLLLLYGEHLLLVGFGINLVEIANEMLLGILFAGILSGYGLERIRGKYLRGA